MEQVWEFVKRIVDMQNKIDLLEERLNQLESNQTLKENE